MQPQQPLPTQQASSPLTETSSPTQKTFIFQTQTKRLKQYYLHSPSLLLQRKILFNNNSGTVKYFGPLKHQTIQKQQLWIGVEWDQIGRGKHNGIVKGYKYFQCKDGQGSMVKYQKIQFGYRLQTALFKRYFRLEEMHHAKSIYEELKLYKNQINQQQITFDNKQQSKPQVTITTNEQTNQQTKGQTKEQTKGLTTNQSQSAHNQTKIQVKKKVHKIQYDSQAYFDSLKKTKRIMVQFVGFDQIWTKINNLDKIQSISLPNCRICDLGPSGHLNCLLKNLRILSLQDNLLSSYSQIYQLGSQLPFLQQLSLTNNHLAQPQQSFQSLSRINLIGHQESIQLKVKEPVFKRLKVLILINTGLNWKIFFKIITAFNKLRELVICRNDMRDYENFQQQNALSTFSQLQTLNLEDTNLIDVKQLMHFSQLPKLEKLTINRNPIQQFGRKITGFQSLKSLSVQHCCINKPVAIYQLSLMRNIQSLHLKHNPINQILGNQYVRLRSIAQFQKLKIINGAPLKKYQRKDSQIFYMRESFREYFALKNKPDYDYDFGDFMKWCGINHPNIQLFINRFGNPYPVEEKKEIKDIIKNQVKQTEIKKGTGMIKLKIYVHDLAVTDEKKIPLSWTLASLRNFFAKTMKVPSNLQILIHKNQAQGIQEEMVQDIKPLSFYNLSETSTIILKRK